MIDRRSLNSAGLFALVSALAAALGAKAPLAAQATSLADAQLALATRLIGGGNAAAAPAKPAPAAGANVVVSPAGLAAALALVGLAGDAATQAAFRSTLQFPLTAKPEDDLVAILDPLGQLDGGADSPLVVANRLVLDAAMKPDPQFLQDLRKHKVDVGTENFADSRTVALLNDWVKKQTRGLVPAIIEDLPPNGGLVALNALYFKDRWLRPFDQNATKSAPFHSLGAGGGEVQMMHQKGHFRFRGEGRFVAADLGFGTPRYALTIVTTKDKPATAGELLAGAGAWLDGRGFTDEQGRLSLPRLQITGSTDLLQPMIKLGLPPSVLLSRLGGGPQKIASILQKATLKLDEQGAEAAAATAVSTLRSVDIHTTQLTVDKPFLFALRDKTTGYVLLAGYVNRPDPVTG